MIVNVDKFTEPCIYDQITKLIEPKPTEVLNFLLLHFLAMKNSLESDHGNEYQVSRLLATEI